MVRLEKRGRRFLKLATLVPMLGIIVVLLAPPPKAGYLPEQAFLLLLALGALVVSRAKPSWAAWAYCALALGPVGAMVARYEVLCGGFNPWVLTPHLGIVVVTLTTRSEPGVFSYSLLAWAAAGVYGWLCNDPGQAGWGMMLTAVVSLCSAWWLDDEAVRGAVEKVGMIERGLSDLLENLDGQ